MSIGLCNVRNCGISFDVNSATSLYFQSAGQLGSVEFKTNKFATGLLFLIGAFLVSTPLSIVFGAVAGGLLTKSYVKLHPEAECNGINTALTLNYQYFNKWIRG